MNVAPDAASIAVTRLLARSEDAVIRPFVDQVSREPRLRNPETNTYGGLYLWADQETEERSIKGEVFNAIKAATRSRREVGPSGSALCASMRVYVDALLRGLPP